MPLDELQFNKLYNRLYRITPGLVDDLLFSMQNDPALVKQYGTNLRQVAEQGIVAFRDTILGALQFDTPQVVNHQLDWLAKLLEARQLQNDKVQIFLQIFRHRVQMDLAPEDGMPILQMLDTVKQYLDRQER